MIEKMLTYFLLAFFFGMDFIIRKDKTAKRIERTKDDNKSTVFILLAFFVVLILSVVLNSFSIGTFDNVGLARTGLAVMIVGIFIRVHSMLTLSKYYTRTLVTVDEQQIIKKGLYKYIRHPGYLGTILIWGAAGLGMTNAIVFIVSIGCMLLAYFYRIQNEERMLTTEFGESYTVYMKHTWRLIPFIW